MLRAQTLVEGYNIIGCDALNVGTKDFGAGLDFLLQLRESANFPFISANIIDEDTRELLFDPYVIVKRGGFTFGVTGLTTALPEHVKNLDLRDPVTEGKRVLKELSEKTDYQVVLFNGSWKEVSDARGPLADADFIFLSGVVRRPDWRKGQPTAGPKLYPLGKQGKSLGVVRLNVTSPDGPLADVTTLKRRHDIISRQFERLNNRDPSRKVEEIFKDNPAVLERIRQMREESSRLEEELSRLENTVEFDFVPMTKKIKDDPTLLAMVSETLSACSKLEGGETGRKSAPSAKTVQPEKTSKTGRLR